MKTVARRIAILVSATAVTVGLMGTASPAEAKDSSWGWVVGGNATTSARDSSWGW